MKSQYVKPEMVEEKFLANKYCVNCSELGNVTYAFVCDAPSSSSVYMENGKEEGLQKTGKNKDQSLLGFLSYYSPCGDTHTVTVPKGTDVSDIFHKGYLGDGTQIVIWRGEDNDDVHCMKALNPQDVPVTKS